MNKKQEKINIKIETNCPVCWQKNDIELLVDPAKIVNIQKTKIICRCGHHYNPDILPQKGIDYIYPQKIKFNLSDKIIEDWIKNQGTYYLNEVA